MMTDALRNMPVQVATLQSDGSFLAHLPDGTDLRRDGDVIVGAIAERLPATAIAIRCRCESTFRGRGKCINPDCPEWRGP